jgi:hypothetical protein
MTFKFFCNDFSSLSIYFDISFLPDTAIIERTASVQGRRNSFMSICKHSDIVGGNSSILLMWTLVTLTHKRNGITVVINIDMNFMPKLNT